MPESGATVLVTGASSGFGELIVRTLHARGHRAVAAVRDPDGRNTAARDRLAGLGGVEVVALDVTDDAAVTAGVAEAIERTGGLDAVVNNAGVGYFGVLEAVEVDQAEHQFQTNVLGPLRVDRAVLPHFRRRRAGLLVQVSSGAGRMVLPLGGIYCASKFAVEALAETYRYELAPFGIDSVIVEPGAYATSFAANGTAAGDQERSSAYGDLAGRATDIITGGTTGDPQEVADAVVDVIETPLGSRRLRTTVGQDTTPLDQLNDQTDALTRQVLEQLGLRQLLATSP